VLGEPALGYLGDQPGDARRERRRLPLPAPVWISSGRPRDAVAALRCASLRSLSQPSCSNIRSSMRHRATKSPEKAAVTTTAF